MIVKRRTGLVLVIVLSFLFALPCIADEIRFQNQKGTQTGVIVGEDNQSMTIRFPKSAIKSVKRTIDESSTALSGQVIWEEGKDYLILKIPRRSIRMVPQKAYAPTRSMKPESASPDVSRKNEKTVLSEMPPESTEKVKTAHRSGSPEIMNAQQELMKEEMGSVEGVILWRRKSFSKGIRDFPGLPSRNGLRRTKENLCGTELFWILGRIPKAIIFFMKPHRDIIACTGCRITRRVGSAGFGKNRTSKSLPGT